MLIKIKELLNKRWPLILLMFAGLGLLVTIILRLITPAEPNIPKTDFITVNNQGKSTSFDNISFTGLPPTAPNRLSIATIEPSQTTLNYVRDQLISNYQLQQVIGADNLWYSETHTLAYDEVNDEFLFYKSSVPTDEPLSEPTRAIDLAQNFVRKNFPNLNLITSRDQITYFQGLDELEETTPTQAAAVEIPFTYTIEGSPVYLSHTSRAPIRIIVSGNYQIQKVVFQPNFINLIPSKQTIAVLDLAAAIDNINNRSEAVVVEAYESVTGVFDLSQIVEGELTTVQLEYRADLETGLVYPFYRFTGELINQAGQTIFAQIITPAVKTQ